MILVNKNVGETPLELVERVRRERPELATEKLSYAGRLDPMAEGEMLILVGEENKDREKFLGLDKEYIATFLVGVKTDTGDALGLIEDLTEETKSFESSQQDIANKLLALREIKQQKYPWFSGQTVDGVKLFDHFKAGRTDADLERPVLNVEIKGVELLNISTEKTEEIRKYIFDAIGKVRGDFRQKEILVRWDEFFGRAPNEIQVFEVRFLVSSGTYIRALTENFGFRTTLLKLKRTQIIGFD